MFLNVTLKKRRLCNCLCPFMALLFELVVQNVCFSVYFIRRDNSVSFLFCESWLLECFYHFEKNIICTCSGTVNSRGEPLSSDGQLTRTKMNNDIGTKPHITDFETKRLSLSRQLGGRELDLVYKYATRQSLRFTKGTTVPLKAPQTDTNHAIFNPNALTPTPTASLPVSCHIPHISYVSLHNNTRCQPL